jgi:hypothetical protein
LAGKSVIMLSKQAMLRSEILEAENEKLRDRVSEPKRCAVEWWSTARRA